MRGGNRGTVAYPLMQTEPLQTAQAIFLRSGTDGYGMRHAVCAGGAGYYENFWDFLRGFERF